MALDFDDIGNPKLIFVLKRAALCIMTISQKWLGSRSYPRPGPARQGEVSARARGYKNYQLVGYHCEIRGGGPAPRHGPRVHG
jgi:hypothetical protein